MDGDAKLAVGQLEDEFSTEVLPYVDPTMDKTSVGLTKVQKSFPILLIDLFNRKSPDLLAGPFWTVPRAFSVDADVYRPIDIDLQGQRLLEWVGPQTAILLWAVEKPNEVNGANFFGLHTFGKEWDNPYAPLAELDSNKDGVLEEGELRQLWLWVDSDSDGYPTDSEVEPFTLRATSIQLSHQTDSDGNSWEDESVKLRDGLTVASWGWGSLGINPTMAVTARQDQTNPGACIVLFKQSNSDEVCLYTWNILGSSKSTSGILRFINTKHGLYVFSTGSSGAMSTSFSALRGVLPFAKFYSTYSLVSKANNSLYWEFEFPSIKDSSTVSIEDGGNILSATAMFQYTKGDGGGPYRWVGYMTKTPDLLPEIVYSLISVDVEEFERGLEQTGMYEVGMLVLPPNDRIKDGGKYPRVININQEVKR